MGLMELLVVFLVAFLLPLCIVMLPIGLIAWLIYALARKRGPQGFTEEETRLMQEMYRSLGRMERRIEHLETIVLDAESKPFSAGATHVKMEGGYL